MKRTIQELREYALSLAGDIEFIWNGSHGLIIPYNKNKFVLTFHDPDGPEEEFHDIDVLLEAPFLDGRSLTEVCCEVEFWG